MVRGCAHRNDEEIDMPHPCDDARIHVRLLLFGSRQPSVSEIFLKPGPSARAGLRLVEDKLPLSDDPALVVSPIPIAQ